MLKYAKKLVLNLQTIREVSYINLTIEGEIILKKKWRLVGIVTLIAMMVLSACGGEKWSERHFKWIR